MLKLRVKSPGSKQEKFFTGLLWGALYCLIGISVSTVFDPVNSLFHPASGIALAALILIGWLALPGIAIGVFFEFLCYGLIQDASTGASVSLSLTATLTFIPQFFLSYFLLTKVLGKNFNILTDRSITWFLLVTLVTSTTGPVLGLITFTNVEPLNGAQGLHMIVLQSVGQSLGYILVTPILLVISQNYKFGHWPQLIRAVSPLMVLFLLTGLWLYGYINLEEERHMILHDAHHGESQQVFPEDKGHPVFGNNPVFMFSASESPNDYLAANVGTYVFIATAISSFIIVGWTLSYSARRQRTEKVVNLRTHQLQKEITERREIEEQLHRSMDMLESVNQGLSSYVIECNKYKSLDELLQKIRDVSQASEAIIALKLSRNEESQQIIARGTSGFPVTGDWSEPFTHLGDQWREYRGINSLFTECLADERTHIYNDVDTSGWSHGPASIHSIAVVPIHYEEKMLGMISMINRPIGFTYNLINYLEPLLATVGVAVKSILDQAERESLNQRIIKQATTDTLTQLPNRNALQKEVKSLLRNRNDCGYLYIHIDLDHFDLINDCHGHQAGDHALRQFAGFIRSKLDRNEQIFHFNGDKFALILRTYGSGGVNRRLHILLDQIRTFRFSWVGHILSVNASIGAVILSANDRSPSTLFQHADFACETAKSLGRNRYHIYNSQEHRPASTTDEMAELAKINSALDQERFVVFAQPIRQTNRLEPGPQMEVLARMVAEDGRLVFPKTFLPIMERFGLSTLLDMQIVQKSISCLKSYHDQGHFLPRITINLSGQSLADPGFLEFLLKTIPTYGKFWEALCFEITETQAISNLISAQNMISTLKSNGCKFALDDFGSGLSSFSYLKDFDVDYLKIDGTFIIDICEDERDRAMIVSIHEMAHALGMKTIAEFAESPAIVSALEEIGIDFIQGYAIGEATPFQDCN